MDPTDRLLKSHLEKPEMQKMMDDIAEVLNNQPNMEKGANSEWFDYFQQMMEYGLRRLEDTDKPVNSEYFAWLFNELRK